MAYDQSELPHIGPTRREIRKARIEKRKARREQRKNTNALEDDLHTMISEGPMFIQTLRRIKQK